MVESDNSSPAEIVLEEKKMTKQEVDQHIAYLFSSDTKFGIIYLLEQYEMLNLKALAKFLGKSQSTIHKHLEDLMMKEYIKIAPTMKGKFYEVSELIEAMNIAQKENWDERNLQDELEELKKMKDGDFLDRAINQVGDENEISVDILLDFSNILGNVLSTMRTINQASIVATEDIFYHIFLLKMLRSIKKKKRKNKQMLEDLLKSYFEINHPEKFKQNEEEINESDSFEIQNIFEIIKDEKLKIAFSEIKKIHNFTLFKQRLDNYLDNEEWILENLPDAMREKMFENKPVDLFLKDFYTIYNHENHHDKVENYLKKNEWKLEELTDEQYREIIINGLAEKKYRDLMEKFYIDEEMIDLKEIRRLFPIGSTNQMNFDVKLADTSQLVEFIAIYIKFIKEMEDLKERLEKENENVPSDQLTTQILNLYSGPLPKE